MDRALTDPRRGGASLMDMGAVALDVRTQQLHVLYRRSYRLVWWTVRAAGVPDPLIEDVVHDTFVAAHRRGIPNDEDQWPTWIVGVARSVAFSHRRGAARRAQRLRALPDPASPPRPDEQLADRQAWRQLSAFVDELPAAQREVFVLSDVKGVAAPAIADALEVNLNTVYSRLRLARRKFNERFSEHRGAAGAFLRTARRQAEPSHETRQRGWALVAAKVGSVAVGPAVAAAPWIGGKTTSIVIGLGLAAAALAVGSTRAASPPEPDVAVVSASASVTPSARPSQPASGADVVDMTPKSEAVAPPRPTRVVPQHEARDPAPAGRERERQRTKPAASAAPESSPKPPADPLADELALLSDATAALKTGQPERALRLLDDHRRSFATSSLSAERTALEVEALCEVGRVDDARTLATRYRRAHPASPLDGQLERRCWAH